MKRTTCANCAHFCAYPEAHAFDGGECRIKPPVVSGQERSQFPVVYYGDWCGELKVLPEGGDE